MKKLLLIILLFPLVVFAADDNEGPYTWNDFSGGQNSHVGIYEVPKNQGAVAENVRVNSEYRSLDKRPSMPLVIDLGTGDVRGLYKYYKTDGTDYLIGAVGTTLEWDNSATATTIKAGLTEGARWTFITYQDIFIGMNGSDNPVKWDGESDATANTDGHRTADNLCADLGAPFAELATGTDLDSERWYQYKVAFYDDTNYQYCTSRSNAILTGAAVYNIALTDVPLGPTGTTERYIYRTSGNTSKANVEADTSFYLVDTISDNTTTTYSDGESDATIEGDAEPIWDTVAAGTDYTPPVGKYCEMAEERIFVAGNSTYRSELYWSEAYKPDIFNPVDLEKIREDDGDSITFIKNFLGILRVGKTRTIQSFYTDASSDSSWYASNPRSEVGCPAPYSAVVTPLGIAYWNQGYWLFNGQISSLFSDPVTPEANDVNESAYGTIVALYADGQYMAAYESKTTGSGSNDRMLLFNFVRKAWVLDFKDIDSFCVLNGGSDSGAIYSGSSDGDGYVYAHKPNFPLLKIRYKSELDGGTFDDSRSIGTESDPELEIAWDCTIDGWLTELQTKDADIDTIDEIGTYLPDAIIDRPDTDGSWVSEVYDLNASNFLKLYWNELLGSSGDITFQLRAGTSDALCQAATWGTAVSDPSGSDVSGTTAARYVQVKCNLETTDIEYSPTIYSLGGYVFKLAYTENTTTEESAFSSTWDSGWHDMTKWSGKAGDVTHLQFMRVYYTGDTGKIDIQYYNDEGDHDNTVTIDLTVNPTDVIGDAYTGVGDEKIFEYWFPVNGDGDDPVGQWWRFVISDNSINSWSVQRLEVTFDPEVRPGG